VKFVASLFWRELLLHFLFLLLGCRKYCET